MQTETRTPDHLRELAFERRAAPVRLHKTELWVTFCA